MLGPDRAGAAFTAATAAAAAAAAAVFDWLDGAGSAAVEMIGPVCERVGGSTVRLSKPENKSAGKGMEPEL